MKNQIKFWLINSIWIVQLLSNHSVYSQDTIKFKPIMTDLGQEVSFDIKVENFENLKRFNINVFWDTLIMIPVDIQYYDYPSTNFSTTSVTDIYYTDNPFHLSIYNTTLDTVNLSIPNNATLCTIKFEKIKQDANFCIKVIPQKLSTFKKIDQKIIYPKLLGLASCQEEPIDTCYIYTEVSSSFDSINVNLKAINFINVLYYHFLNLQFNGSNLEFDEKPISDKPDLGLPAKYSHFAHDYGIPNFDYLSLYWWSSNGVASVEDGSIINNIKFKNKGLDSTICFVFLDTVPEVDENRIECVAFKNNLPQFVPIKFINSCSTFNYNTIKGTILQDENNNCTFDGEVKVIPYSLVKIDNGTKSAYARTNEQGQYTKIITQPGSYSISAISPSEYWASCDVVNTVTFDSVNETKIANTLINPVLECPKLEVHISASRFRVCSTSIFKIYYYNSGTVPALDAYVNLQLPAELHFSSSSIPGIDLGNGLFKFGIGNINEFAGGSFLISIDVPCDENLASSTQCVEAHIYPDTICTMDSLLNHIQLAIKAKCDTNKVIFEISNTGDEDMIKDLAYTTIEDDLMPGLIGKIKLDKGQTIQLEFPSNGRTKRIWFDALPNDPYQVHFTKGIEGCGIRPDGKISRGFINQFSLGDQSPFYDEYCGMVYNSYDPNEKLASPEGYTNNNIIDKNDRIEYNIHFQNTGIDTAFRVVVIDTISEDLDLSTLEVYAASHPFTLNMQNDRILQFTFLPIHLVDKNTDELGSQGYVHYSIRPRKNIPLGTKIRNTAQIIFDFNPPISTNTYEHTIGEGIITATLNYKHPNYSIKAYPNPFHEKMIFELGNQINDFNLEIYDAFGRLLINKKANSNVVSIENIELKYNGIYYYVIKNYDKQIIANGSLIKK